MIGFSLIRNMECSPEVWLPACTDIYSCSQTCTWRRGSGSFWIVFKCHLLYRQAAELLKVLEVRRGQDGDGDFIECNNMTLINLVLKFFGQIHERNLTVIMLIIQVEACKRLHTCLTVPRLVYFVFYSDFLW